MRSLSAISFLTSILVLLCIQHVNSFSVPSHATIRTPKLSTPLRASSAIEPSSDTTVGVVGTGYLPTLAAKLAAYRRHGKAWVICPSAEIDVIRQIVAEEDGGEPLSNLELVPASDSERVEELLAQTDALLFATDDVDSVVDTNVIDYIFGKTSDKLKRVVAMSRNLNGKGMGFFATA